MEQQLSLADINYWLDYFNNRGIIVDFNKVKSQFSEIRQLERILRKSTDIDVVEYQRLSNQIKYKKSVLDNLILYSTKFLEGQYLDGVGFINAYDGDTIEVYPKHTLTSTYRISTSYPCISNLDNSFRELIIPEKFRNLLSIDFKHHEPWIIVNLIEDVELLNIIENNDDFYFGILKKFNVEETLQNREIVKTVWNACFYGSSRYKIPIQEEWIDKVFDWINTNEKIVSLRNKVERNLKEDKCVYTKFTLTRDISYDGKKSVLQGFNTIFQMTGAEIMYLGLGQLEELIESKFPEFEIYLTLHDEFLLTYPEDISEERLQDFINNLDFSVDSWTPPRVKVSVGKNWSDCK